jgi:uncharacterized oxidoreductase
MEARNRAERGAKGIPLPDDTWNSIVATAHAVGVEGARIPAAA